MRNLTQKALTADYFCPSMTILERKLVVCSYIYVQIWFSLERIIFSLQIWNVIKHFLNLLLHDIDVTASLTYWIEYHLNMSVFNVFFAMDIHLERRTNVHCTHTCKNTSQSLYSLTYPGRFWKGKFSKHIIIFPRNEIA